MLDESNISDDAELFRDIFDSLPKQYVTMLNIPKYKNVLLCFAEVKRYVDSYMLQFGETAEYLLPFSDYHSVLTDTDFNICVRIPKDTGIDFCVSELKKISSFMSDTDFISVEPCADGKTDIMFCFKDVSDIVVA